MPPTRHDELTACIVFVILLFGVIAILNILRAGSQAGWALTVSAYQAAKEKEKNDRTNAGL